MRSKQYLTSIKNNPHEISTDPLYGRAVFSSEYIKRKTTDNLVIDGFLLVIRLGLEPRTPTLKVLCSTC